MEPRRINGRIKVLLDTWGDFFQIRLFSLGFLMLLLGVPVLAQDTAPQTNRSLETLSEQDLLATFRQANDTAAESFPAELDERLIRDSSREASLVALARLRLEQEQPEEAFELLVPAAERLDDPGLLHRTARLGLRLGRQQAVRDLLETTSPRDFPRQRVTEQMSLMAKVLPRADVLDWTRTYLRSQSEIKSEIRRELTMKLLTLRDYQGDSETWMSAKLIRPLTEATDPRPHDQYLLGYSLMGRGLYEVESGRRLRGEDRLAKAKELFQSVLRENWRASNAFHGLAFLHWHWEEYDTALSAAEGALAEEPGVARFHDTLGLIKRDLGNLEEARSAWREARRLDSDYRNHRFGRLLSLPPIADRLEALVDDEQS